LVSDLSLILFRLLVITRRGDFEVLAYNIVHWLSSKLPWDAKLKDADGVQKAKESAMQNVPAFLKDCFGKKPVPGKFVHDITVKYLNTVPETFPTIFAFWMKTCF
jgi:hypothetical protein